MSSYLVRAQPSIEIWGLTTELNEVTVQIRKLGVDAEWAKKLASNNGSQSRTSNN
ncbi:hypothetical protein [Chitinophaga sp. CF118]|uniref:hypothetical protein n=1 Tax=Chitinophaga sp. CF118 TaxID=1884367 RepID=UPI0015A4F5D0|nr:hypothetical protein [Chitinophaga sp. CF118]